MKNMLLACGLLWLVSVAGHAGLGDQGDLATSSAHAASGAATSGAGTGADSGAKSGANAGASAEQQAAALLREAAQRTQHLTTLFATFTQEKKLSMLDMPLTSSGFMCLERKGAAQNAERVLWVYEKPAPSGFAQENGAAWLWAGEGASRRRAQGAEATALKAVTAQIMAWVRIRPDELQRLYRMERVDAGATAAMATTGTTAGTAPVLRLTPRPNMSQAVSFFSALEVTLSPELNTVRQLRFVEKNGDSTVLTFSNTRVNADLPPQCQSPQPLP